MFNKKHCFDEVLSAFLEKLSQGVEIGGHLHGGWEEALAVLAFAFREELAQPFGEIEQIAFVHFEDLHALAGLRL